MSSESDSNEQATSDGDEKKLRSALCRTLSALEDTMVIMSTAVAPNETTATQPTSTGGGKLGGALVGNGSAFEEAMIGLASGIIFGFVSPCIGHPFDTVKTRMQCDAAYQTATFRHTVLQIYRTEGVLRGFYRGFIPPLIGSMAFRGLLFSSYAASYSACESVPMLQQEIPFTGGLRPSVLIGALTASFARASIESPLDFIKVRYMIGKEAMQGSSSSSPTAVGANGNTGATVSSMQALKQFASSPVRNIQHLYKGFLPTLFRTMGLLGSFFIMIDYSIRYIPDVVNSPMGPFFKGGICATAAWVFAFPFESAKSAIQGDTVGRYQNMGTAKVMAALYRERGLWHGLYRGFGPGASRSFVANGISMTVYSWFQELVRNDR
jgi:solute carrier family 25 (mitochondrial carnitine/acylcarnitine transporter), member 20/29